MKNNRIIPTVFSHNKKEFNPRFEKLVPITKKIQIDFMDGKFVPGKSISMKEIPNLKKYNNEFEAHLMVQNPREWIKQAKEKGFKRIIFHYEAIPKEEIFSTGDYSNSLKLETYLAVNPDTKLKILLNVLSENENLFKGVLFLGVHPGKEGQKLQRVIFRRIKKLKKICPELIAQIDGGINEKTVKKAAKSGADFVNSGSFVSNSDNPTKQIEKLESAFHKN